MKQLLQSQIFWIGFIIGCLVIADALFGDTVHLTNGRTLDAESTATAPVVIGENEDGDPVHDARTVGIPENKIRLLYSNGGYQDVLKKNVDRIEENDRDAFTE
jgi:hypothetical protein